MLVVDGGSELGGVVLWYLRHADGTVVPSSRSVALVLSAWVLCSHHAPPPAEGLSRALHGVLVVMILNNPPVECKASCW